MNALTRRAVAMSASSISIGAFEFVRNQVFLIDQWKNHYASFGRQFATEPINGAMWMVWAFVFSFGISELLKVMGLVKTIILSWIFGFVLMWIVIGNMGVLPFSILPYAIPLSLIEVCSAAWIIQRIEAE